MATVFAVGVGVAAAAFFGRAGLVALRRARGSSSALGKSFYKGGFEKQMNRREAALILGTSERGLNKDMIRRRHRALMLLNHPDRGGSPYLATKCVSALCCDFETIPVIAVHPVRQRVPPEPCHATALEQTLHC
ncbi:hypothetical protein BST61_g8745 [Cercospora zeina]